MKTKSYTLVEMICVIGLLAFLLNVVFVFFYDGTKTCRNALQNATLNNEVNLLRKKWRSFVRECPGQFEVEDGILRSGANFAKSEKGTLLFSVNGRERKFRFPENVSFNFAKEKEEGLPECIVLEIKAPEKQSIRIVACEKQ